MSNNPDDCDHSDGSENGICVDCGEEVDWTEDFFGWADEDEED